MLPECKYRAPSNVPGKANCVAPCITVRPDFDPEVTCNRCTIKQNCPEPKPARNNILMPSHADVVRFGNMLPGRRKQPQDIREILNQQTFKPASNRVVISNDLPKQFEIAVAITTVPQRFNAEFKRTMESLKASGFEDIIIFVDSPKTEEADYESYGLPVVYREKSLGVATHWFLTASELYTRHPFADRFVIFQDDLIICKNVRKYLEFSEWPGNGYLNLYTWPDNHNFLHKTRRINTKGWVESNQMGRGALALVFNNDSVKHVISHPHMIDRFQGEWRHRKVDGGIVETMRKLNYKEYIHNPSLTQHTGEVSSIKDKFPQGQVNWKGVEQSPSFVGEEFDALNFLSEEQRAKALAPPVEIVTEERGIGDVVADALKLVGITEERVTAWIGEPCGCAERREKLNALGRWAKAAVSSGAEKAKGFLKNLMGGE